MSFRITGFSSDYSYSTDLLHSLANSLPYASQHHYMDYQGNYSAIEVAINGMPYLCEDSSPLWDVYSCLEDLMPHVSYFGAINRGSLWEVTILHSSDVTNMLDIARYEGVHSLIRVMGDFTDGFMLANYASHLHPEISR